MAIGVACEELAGDALSSAHIGNPVVVHNLKQIDIILIRR